MARFSFQAKSLTGKKVSGYIESSDVNTAKTDLRSKQLITLHIAPAPEVEKTSLSLSSPLFQKPVKPKELQIFTKQFAVLLDAGVPVVQSLESMVSGGTNPTLNKALDQIVGNLKGGKKLSESMSQHSHIFNYLYLNLIRVGEESGNLKQVLTLLAGYIEKSTKLRKKVIGALIYPAVVSFVSILIVGLIITFVIPEFQKFFSASNKELPAITQFTIDLSHFFQSYWLLFFGGLILTPISFYILYGMDTGKKLIDRIMIGLPAFGNVILKADLARFSRNLATLLNSGVRIIKAIEISIGAITNDTVQNSFSQVTEAILRGRSLVEPLRNSKYIPNMVLQMIDIGEKTGSLDNMMSKIADFYEDEVEVAVDIMTQLLNPLLIVMLAIIIGFIVISITLPLFNIADIIA